LHAAFDDHPLVGEVRGVGLIAAVELVENRETRTNFDPKLKIGARFSKLMEDNGVIGRSLVNDSMAFSPPLIITEAEVDEVVENTSKALAELTAQLRREHLSVVG
jgi:4-aminobutyrate--pyruvate transaminase